MGHFMINQDGETVSDTDVITEPSLLFWIYICPDVCPMDSAQCRAVDLLCNISATPIFISIDPKETHRGVAELQVASSKMIGLTDS